MNALSIPIMAGIAYLCLSLPFFGLFGFFEDRKEGSYQFRFKRFLLCIGVLCALNVVSAFLIIISMEDLMMVGMKRSELHILRMRSAPEFVLNNFKVMFPDILTDKTEACFRAALSNYVEDKWKSAFHTATCNSPQHFCSDSIEAYDEALLNESKPKQNIIVKLQMIGHSWRPIGAASSEMFKQAEKLFPEPDSQGNVQELADESALADYRSYFDRCSTLKALPWAQAGAELVTSRVISCIGWCP
jgi:hypothetical protein